jgi:hypothetical protein
LSLVSSSIAVYGIILNVLSAEAVATENYFLAVDPNEGSHGASETTDFVWNAARQSITTKAKILQVSEPPKVGWNGEVEQIRRKTKAQKSR